MSMNKGEWSEIYSFFKLLTQDNIAIYNSQLNQQLDSYKLVSVYKYDIHENEIEFTISNNKETINFVIQNNSYSWDKLKLINLVSLILTTIKRSSGTFSIDEVDNILTQHNIVLKAPSHIKNDLSLKIIEKTYQTPKKLGYSIKSKLGSLSTLLNASNHTNFKYQITGLNSSEIQIINNIQTRTKLQDRYHHIINNGGKFQFISVTSKQFSHNLRMIDSDIEFILARILLLSYELGTKDLNVLIRKVIELNPSNIQQQIELYYNDRLNRILKGITLGMQPSVLYQPSNNINGGMLIVEKDGSIKILDSIYYPNELQDYLFQNIKLDSPSSTRYKMLELYEENNQIFCTLNLQLRFKE